MKRFITAALAAIFCLALTLSSCAPVKDIERGALSAQNMLSGGRIYHAAKISALFQYINPDSADGTVIEPEIPCANAGCTHSDDSCPAYIRGLTCWVPLSDESGDFLLYAQMRSYINQDTHQGAKHNVIARLNVENGATDTFLQDWQYVIDQLLIYGGNIYFLSKNADGLRDVWVMPQGGGTPMLYVQNDGVDLTMLGMEDGVLYLQNENGGVFRADLNDEKVTLTQLLDCDYNVGVYVYGGYVYYPVKDNSTAEYEYLPGRTEYDEASGENMEVAVAVNSCDYYRIPVSGGKSELVTSGVQATFGGLCSDGVLYLPVWNFKYYGSSESDGAYTDYFSRTSGEVAAVELDSLKVTVIASTGLDFSEIYAVTDDYVFGKASSPESAYADGSDPSDFYALYDLSDGSVRSVDFN